MKKEVPGYENYIIYDNGDLYNKLPEELRNVIINTTVVSGHGWSNSSSNRSDGN